MKMIAKQLTANEIRQDERRGYNPSEWDRAVDRMLKYENVKFYLVEKGNGYDYDRHFVEYTLDEGLRLFGSFGYGGSMTSGGFYRLDKCSATKEGQTIDDLIELNEQNKQDEAKILAKKLAETKLVKISFGKFIDEDGNSCLFNTTKEARKQMIELSSNLGMTFTKG